MKLQKENVTFGKEGKRDLLRNQKEEADEEILKRQREAAEKSKNKN